MLIYLEVGTLILYKHFYYYVCGMTPKEKIMILNTFVYFE